MFQVDLVSYMSGNLERRQGNENNSTKSNTDIKIEMKMVRVVENS